MRQSTEICFVCRYQPHLRDNFKTVQLIKTDVSGVWIYKKYLYAVFKCSLSLLLYIMVYKVSIIVATVGVI